eukprot:scaffold1272_cov250-Pinguiococcus_pyrenoidosus.AAC.57
MRHIHHSKGHRRKHTKHKQAHARTRKPRFGHLSIVAETEVFNGGRQVHFRAWHIRCLERTRHGPLLPPHHFSIDDCEIAVHVLHLRLEGPQGLANLNQGRGIARVRSLCLHFCKHLLKILLQSRGLYRAEGRAPHIESRRCRTGDSRAFPRPLSARRPPRLPYEAAAMHPERAP